MSLDVDPADRSFDRLLACFGLLDDAAPLFAAAVACPAPGCSAPSRCWSKAASSAWRARLYGEIGPAFYGLRTTLLTLLLMALLRIKRPEELKERDPQTLGRAARARPRPRGQDAAAQAHPAGRLPPGRAARRGAGATTRRAARPPHGLPLRRRPRARLPRQAQRCPRPTSPACACRCRPPPTTGSTTQAGDPLFVITAEANAGMAKMLPEVLAEVRELVGDRRVTIVFDRGGWSPKLFQRSSTQGFDILTYRKGKSRRIGEQRFVLRQRQARRPPGRATACTTSRCASSRASCGCGRSRA